MIVLGVSTANIDGFLKFQVITLAVHRYSTVTTDVDDADLTVVEQTFFVRSLLCIERCDARQRQRLCCRLGSPNEETVKERISPVDLTGYEDLLDKVFLTQTVCGIVLGIYRTGGIAHIIVCIGIFTLHGI